MASAVALSSSFLVDKKNVGFSALCKPPSFLRSAQFSKTRVSKNIGSAKTPQISERKPSTTGAVKASMTMVEKILARASGKSQLGPGETVWANVDVLMIENDCGTDTIRIFKKEFGENAKVWDSNKLVIPDPNINCLQFLAQNGHCRPGEVLLGTDSHMSAAGAFGQFATEIGPTDAALVLGAGKYFAKVPPTIRVEMVGEMPNYTLPHDLILKITGEIPVANKAIEFAGTAIQTFSMEKRITLCNMVVDAGGKYAFFPADSATFEYLEDKTSVPYEPVYSDGQARYHSECRIDLSKLEPMVGW